MDQFEKAQDVRFQQRQTAGLMRADLGNTRESDLQRPTVSNFVALIEKQACELADRNRCIADRINGPIPENSATEQRSGDESLVMRLRRVSEILGYAIMQAERAQAGF